MSDIPAAPVDPTAPTAPVTGKRSRETTPEDELPVRRTKPLGAPPRAMEVAELFDADAPFDTVAPLLLGSWFPPFMVPAAPDEHDELRGTLGWGVATAILADPKNAALAADDAVYGVLRAAARGLLRGVDSSELLWDRKKRNLRGVFSARGILAYAIFGAIADHFGGTLKPVALNVSSEAHLAFVAAQSGVVRGPGPRAVFISTLYFHDRNFGHFPPHLAPRERKYLADIIRSNTEE